MVVKATVKLKLKLLIKLLKEHSATADIPHRKNGPGCWGSDYAHFHRAVQMLQTTHAGALWDSLTLNRYSLSEVDEAMRAVESGSVVKALITLTS